MTAQAQFVDPRPLSWVIKLIRHLGRLTRRLKTRTLRSVARIMRYLERAAIEGSEINRQLGHFRGEHYRDGEYWMRRFL